MEKTNRIIRPAAWQFMMLLFIGYFLAWMFPRMPAIAANTLQSDDFWLGVYSWGGVIAPPSKCQLPPKDYRWITQGIFCIQGQFIPGWLLSSGPKYLAGLSMATLALLNFKLLTRWNIPKTLAMLLPLVFIFHPIVNEITLWNTTFPFGIWLCMILSSFLLLDGKGLSLKTWLAIAALLIAVFAYEIYLIFFLVLVVFEVVVQRLMRSNLSLKSTIFKFLVFVGISSIYLLQIFLVNYWFGAPEGRGLVTNPLSIEFISEKLHGIFNLIVNLFMPIIGFHTNIEIAWSAWKWVPIMILVSTFVLTLLRRKSLFDSCFFSGGFLFLLILPTFPIFASSQTPEAWRISILVLLAASLALTPMLVILWGREDVMDSNIRSANVFRIAAISVLVVIFAYEIPVTFAESKLRVEENALDNQIVNQIKTYWRDADLDKEYQVGVFMNLGLLKTHSPKSALNITAAYHSRGLLSAFQFEQSWRGFLELKGLEVVELDSNDELDFHDKIIAGCERKPQACRLEYMKKIIQKCHNKPDFIQSSTSIRVAHFRDLRFSAICL